MEAKNFIISKLKELSNNTPKGAIIEYQYEQRFEEHLIKITPLSAYDSELIWNFRVELDKYFEEVFPLHSLMFLSIDSLVDLTRVDYSFIQVEGIIENQKKAKYITNCNVNTGDYSFNYALAA
jgi:hypothetical protein